MNMQVHMHNENQNWVWVIDWTMSCMALLWVDTVNSFCCEAVPATTIEQMAAMQHLLMATGAATVTGHQCTFLVNSDPVK